MRQDITIRQHLHFFQYTLYKTQQVVGVGPRHYLLTAQQQAMPYASPTSWMIQGVVIDGKVVGWGLAVIS